MVKKDDFLLKTLKIFYNVLGFEDNVDDHEPGRPTTREKFEKNDYLYHGKILSALDDKL